MNPFVPKTPLELEIMIKGLAVPVEDDCMPIPEIPLAVEIAAQGLAGFVQDRVPISQWWPWRWLFWRRIRCSAYLGGGCRCTRPAVIKCVDGRCGLTYARDPLCALHGKVGPCPNAPPREWRPGAVHVPIPESQKWRRVHLRLRMRFEPQED